MELPAIIGQYKSEYHYLFKEIYEFNKLGKPLKSDKLLFNSKYFKKVFGNVHIN